MGRKKLNTKNLLKGLCQKKTYLITLPFLVVIVIFTIFFTLAFWATDPNVRSLFIGLAANSIFILIALFGYELIVKISKRKLDQEIFEYAKLKIDPDIFSIHLLISKLLYEAKGGVKGENISNLHKLNNEDIIEILKDKEFFGFQIFKISDETEKYFNKILENSFILSRLEDKHILTLIQIINSLKDLQRVLLNEKNYYILKDKEDVKDYKVVKGTDINPNNASYPNRYLLMKLVDKQDQSKMIVEDSGDFREEDIEKLLGYYAIKPANLEAVAEHIHEVLELLWKWIKFSDGKLIFSR